MLESWLLPWLPGAKLLPCVLGVTLNPGEASLVASGVALVCQGLLGAPVPLQPAGKGQGREQLPRESRGRSVVGCQTLAEISPGLFRTGRHQECESVSTDLLMFGTTAKPCACRNPRQCHAALGEAGRSG